MFPHLVDLVVRIAFPRSFRDSFGAELTADAIARASSQQGSRRSSARYRSWILFDLLQAGLRERVDAARLALAPEFSAAGITYAVRGLRKSAVFTFSTIVVLGLSISGCVLTLAVSKAYLFTGAPLPDADRLVWVDYWTLPGGEGLDPWGAPTGLNALDWAVTNRLGEAALMQREIPLALVGDDPAVWTSGSRVNSAFFEILGRPPALGRYFDASDGPNVAVLSHNLWTTRFDGSSDIVGRMIQAHSIGDLGPSKSLEVIGVLPPDMWFPVGATDVLVPLPGQRAPRMIRLRAGIDPSDAADRLAESVSAQSPEGIDSSWRPRLTYLEDQYREAARGPILALLVAVGTLLGITLSNISVLMRVRSEGRRMEFATRRALGAPGGRLMSQLMIEAAVLVASAAVLGLGAAIAAMRPFATLLESRIGTMPGGAEAVALDIGQALVVSAGLLIITLTLGGIAAFTLREARIGGQQLRSRSATPGSQDLFTGLQVGLSVTVLVIGGLLGRSVLQLSQVEMGYEAEGAIAAEIALHSTAYQDPEKQSEFFRQLLDATRTIPTVENASILRYSLALDVPRAITVQEADRSESSHSAVVQPVGDGFFQTLRVPLLLGRGILPTDNAEAPPVAVVGASFAAAAWPDGNPLGRQVRLGLDDDRWHTVVGVSGNVREHLTRPDLANVYVSKMRHPSAWATILVRTTGSVPAIMSDVRAAAARIDPDLPIWDLRPLSQRIEAPARSIRFLALILSALAVFAITITAFGVYGNVAYRVERQSRQLRIRMALGAQFQHVATQLMIRVGQVVLVGVGAGLFAAAGTARVVESQLYGIRTYDPLTYVLIGLGTFTIALLAAGMASWRATKIPIAAMD